ncbi:MAG: hypothetical protein FJW31_03795 [Acidobacteria bacterium]|nr:hypothetical protein [Acidobacteriota bacterium]
MTLPHPALQAILVAVAMAAAVTDLRSRRIPNWLTVSAVVAAFAVRAALSGWTGVLAAAMGFALAMAIYAALFALRVMGGGDVKLMAALGAIAGPANWLVIFFITSLIGGPIVLVTVLLRGRLGKTLRNVWAILLQLARLRPPYEANPELDVAHPASVGLPHGAMIALGVGVFLAVARLV